jgi:hypothetical protein
MSKVQPKADDSGHRPPPDFHRSVYVVASWEVFAGYCNRAEFATAGEAIAHRRAMIEAGYLEVHAWKEIQSREFLPIEGSNP